MVLIGPVERYGDTDLDIITFPNGYSVMITFEDSYSVGGCSRFDSKCRKCVLKDCEGNIISEITEKNPHRIPNDILIEFFGW